MEESVFWEVLKKLCKERGTSPSAVAKELGFSSGAPTVWKRGATPSMATIGKLAEFFQVDMQVFYTGIVETKKAPTGDPEEDMERILRFALFDGEDVSDDGWQMVVAFAKLVKEREKKKKESDD